MTEADENVGDLAAGIAASVFENIASDLAIEILTDATKRNDLASGCRAFAAALLGAKPASVRSIKP